MKCSRILLRTVALLALFAASARAATFTVCSSGCDFTSIQAAHDAIGPGHTLDILETVTEQGITLSHGIDLISSLPEPQIIQAAAEPGTATDRVFLVDFGTDVTMENLIVRHGVAGGPGGGIYNTGILTLTRVRIEKNRAASGGGIFAEGKAGMMTIKESTIQSNVATGQGGGIYTDGDVVLVERSTIAKNRALEGGGIMNRFSSGLTVNNCTISMNVAPNGGGGIFNERDASVAVNSSTFALNSLRAIQNEGDESVFTIRNSILGNSLQFDFEPGGIDCGAFQGGTITDLGYNQVENPGTCIFASGTSVTGVDPGLSALADYGGPTRTHAILGTSAAGNSGDAGALTVDQRNVSRPQGGQDDKGSFEFRAAGEPVRPAAFCAPVVANGQIHFVEFESFEHRSPNFSVQIQSGGGFNSFTPNFFHHGTYMGTLDGVPGAIAGATYFPLTGEHYYHVIFEDGTQWRNEGGATQDTTGVVGTTWPHLVPGPAVAASVTWSAEVGVDLPSTRFVNHHGSDADDALAMIEHSVMAANLVYLQQASIQHLLGRVVLRGDPAQDPYAGFTTHTEYLNELEDQWDNVLSANTHDVALVVGVADAGGLARRTVGDPGYSSNAATMRGDFSLVWRHEVGHNWSLSHFDGGSPEGPTINSGNTLGRMSGPEQALVIDHRVAHAHLLDFSAAPTLLVPPRAATDRALVSVENSSVLIDILANDHDINGDALTLLSIGSTSELALGGTMSHSAIPGTVRYTRPSTGPTSAIDRFRYRIRDASGLESVGFVYVRLVDFNPPGTYQQNFDAFADGASDFDDGSYVANVLENTVAQVRGQALELTPDVAWRRASFTLPPQDLQGGFVATFRYRITAAGTPADGFSFNFGAPNATRLPVEGIGSFPSGLTIEWATFQAPGHHVRVDGTEVPGGFLADTGLADGQWHAVELSWSPQAGLSLTVDGNSIFQQLATPGFVPTAEDMLAFSASTGASSEQVLIDDISVNAIATSMEDDGVPRVYALHANVPNPFNPATLLRFDLPRPGTVDLTIYDVRGRQVRHLLAGKLLPTGRHEVVWHGGDEAGNPVASGTYLYRLTAGDYVSSRRMVLLR